MNTSPIALAAYLDNPLLEPVEILSSNLTDEKKITDKKTVSMPAEDVQFTDEFAKEIGYIGERLLQETLISSHFENVKVKTID
ncbi:MAG: hypothetical protein QM632_00785 [Micrococcaceae bacterium]